MLKIHSSSDSVKNLCAVCGAPVAAPATNLRKHLEAADADEATWAASLAGTDPRTPSTCRGLSLTIAVQFDPDTADAAFDAELEALAVALRQRRKAYLARRKANRAYTRACRSDAGVLVDGKWIDRASGHPVSVEVR